MVALAGLRRSRVRIRQFLRSLKPCSTGARAADRAWFACRRAGVVLLVRVDVYPVMMTGSSGSGSRPVNPGPARAPGPAARSRSGRWSWRAVMISLGSGRDGELAGRGAAQPAAVFESPEFRADVLHLAAGQVDPGPLGGLHAGHRPAGLGRDRGDRIQQGPGAASQWAGTPSAVTSVTSTSSGTG